MSQPPEKAEEETDDPGHHSPADGTTPDQDSPLVAAARARRNEVLKKAARKTGGRGSASGDDHKKGDEGPSSDDVSPEEEQQPVDQNDTLNSTEDQDSNGGENSNGGQNSDGSDDDEIVVPTTSERYGRKRRRRRNRKDQDEETSSGTPLSDRKSVDLALRYGFLAALLAAPLLLGGVHPISSIGLGAAGVVLGSLALLAHRDRTSRFGLIGTGLVIWAGLTALQTIPLPFAVVEALSPATADRYAQAAHAIGEDVGWIPFSLSPVETAQSTWTILGFLGIFLVANLHLRKRERFEWIIPRMVAVGLIYVVISIVQTGVFDTTVLGLYEPEIPARGGIITTLINSNHAGAFFGAFAGLSLGAGLSSRDPGLRNTFVVFYLILSVAMFLTLSRAAILSWAVSHVAFLYVMRSERLERPWVIGAIAAVMLATVAVGVWAGQHYLGKTFDEMVSGLDMVVSETQRSDEQPETLDEVLAANLESAENRQPREKVALYRDVQPMVSTWALTGIGRGGFNDAFPAFNTQGTRVNWPHLENEYLELVVEYGVPGALLILGLLTIGLLSAMARPDWRPPERPRAAGLFMAIAFLAIHNLFDFNLRFAGVGFVMAGCLGLLAGRATRYLRVQRRRNNKDVPATLKKLYSAGRPVLTLAAVAALAVALLGLPTATRNDSIDQVQTHVQDLTNSGPSQDPEEARTALMEVAVPAVTLHPSNGYLHFLVAVGLLRTGTGGLEAAMPWLERSRELAPGDYRVHLLLGRAYASQGDTQRAAKQLSIAGTLDWGTSRAVVQTAAELMPDVDHLMASLSAEPVDWGLLGNELIARQRYADAMELGERLADKYPDNVQGLDIQLRVSLALDFPEGAEQLAEQMRLRFPELPLSWLRASSVARALGKHQKADDILVESLDAHPRSLPLLFARADLLLSTAGRQLFDGEQKWTKAMDDLMEQMRPAALPHNASRWRYYIYKARFAEGREDKQGALKAYEEALRVRKTPNMRVKVFEAAVAAGNLQRADELIVELEDEISEKRLNQLLSSLEAKRKELSARGLYAPDRMKPSKDTLLKPEPEKGSSNE